MSNTILYEGHCVMHYFLYHGDAGKSPYNENAPNIHYCRILMTYYS